ncbi:MAG: hypothetical protein IMZ44_10265 [Planctomycetes bacterium]|nr:hypothetical protein [Planctomycetota bacterium]
MDAKTAVIGLLVVSAVLLGGLVASGLREENAYAQGGVYATYLATTANVQEQFVNFVVLDTDSRRLLFYRVEQGKWTIEPTAGFDLTKEFKHAGP